MRFSGLDFDDGFNARHVNAQFLGDFDKVLLGQADYSVGGKFHLGDLDSGLGDFLDCYPDRIGRNLIA